MATAVQKEDLYQEGKELAIKARDEMIETGKVTVVCPKCHKIPLTKVEGRFHEYVSIHCSCGYISLIERGI